MESQTKNVTPKKRGRPATGKDPHLTMRAPKELIEKIDIYAQAESVPRSEAVRRLVEFALGHRVTKDSQT